MVFCRSVNFFHQSDADQRKGNLPYISGNYRSCTLYRFSIYIRKWILKDNQEKTEHRERKWREKGNELRRVVGRPNLLLTIRNTVGSRPTSCHFSARGLFYTRSSMQSYWNQPETNSNVTLLLENCGIGYISSVIICEALS